MVRPSERKEMAKIALARHKISVRLACKTFFISESCFRYKSLLKSENERIAEYLMHLCDVHRNWGFGLCFLYLRNVRKFPWNHKRVYRIYRELEL